MPYVFWIKDRNFFCVPGLYHYAPIPDVETGEARGTFTLITRSANSVMKHIHNGGPNADRMPLFLKDKEMEMKWLLPDLKDEEITEVLAYELPGEALDYWPVHTIRSPKPRPDGNSKHHPWGWPGLPELGSEEMLKQTEEN